MKDLLIRKLKKAQGRSEFVIALFCDVRGFSTFSTSHESPDTAMYIKRFYLKLLTEYFKKANFAKPTGDGLLMTFRYTDKSLMKVSEYVLKSCFKALSDYPTMFRDDLMINFKTPASIGFGVSRGTTCCLYSGKDVIDYSGRLLNLAARLNDFARPSGVVIDGAYLMNVVPADLHAQFTKREVYVRSIAEVSAIPVFCSLNIDLPSHALKPLSAAVWKMKEKTLTRRDFKKLTSNSYRIFMPSDFESNQQIVTKIKIPHAKLPNHFSWNTLHGKKVETDASGTYVLIASEPIRNLLKAKKFPLDRPLSIEVHYLSKPSVLTTKKS